MIETLYINVSSHIRGGVVILCKEHLDVRHPKIDVSKFCVELHIEMCGLIWHHTTQIFILVCYRPPSGEFNIFLDKLGLLLETIYSNNKDVLLVGDFNVHFGTNDSRAIRLNNLLLSYNIIGLVKKPTRINAVLDNIFTNISGDVIYDVTSRVYRLRPVLI